MDNANDLLPTDPQAVPPFRVGAWLVRTDLNRLVQEDRSIQVRPRVMHVLVCLAHQPGQVISRGTLLNTIWGDVEIAEEGLTVAISELRRLLGDDARSSHSIETIRKVGYRLVAPVSALGDGELAGKNGNGGIDSEGRGRDPQPTGPARRSSWPVPYLLGTLLAAALLVGGL
ncbi:MAG: winged helix-turn-helix domain-containing protein [Planctomycetota bacterium]